MQTRLGRSPVTRRAGALFVAAALVAASVLSNAALAVASDPLTVQTASGAVHGIADGTVNEWRGIPYATPPTGALRWRAPQPPTSWVGVREATEFGSHCIQVDFAGGTLGSEDCLYLNVFAPAGGGAGLPVMVHLHPGGNGQGWGYEEGSHLVDRGVIVVTLNYRLGIFGFAGHPALTAEGSLPEQGLLDQIAALQWVRLNIAAFGGDASNVTLFGMSAGSFDTVALAASPLAAGLFQRAAVETDAFWPATGIGNSVADKEQVGVDAAAAVGCTSAADVAACLRATSAESLVLAAGPMDVAPLVGGTVLPQSALAAFQQHGAGVPLLIGSNREEAVFFVLPSPDPFRQGLFVRSVGDLVGTAKTAAVLKLYPASSYDSLAWTDVAIYTDAVYTCPVRRLAVAASQFAPTYRYLFTHVMENDADQAQFRAFHTLEDTFLWHHFYPLASGDAYNPTAAEEGLSATMAAYWTNFAKTGNPNGTGLPVWPTYAAGQESYLTLDDNVQAASAYHVAQCGLMDTIVPYATCTSLCQFFYVSQSWHRRFPH